MASSSKMTVRGIVWVVGIFTLITMALLGSVIMDPILSWALQQSIHPALSEGFGLMFWFMPMYYTILLIMGIVLTYCCFVQTVETTDYYTELGGY